MRLAVYQLYPRHPAAATTFTLHQHPDFNFPKSLETTSFGKLYNRVYYSMKPVATVSFTSCTMKKTLRGWFACTHEHGSGPLLFTSLDRANGAHTVPPHGFALFLVRHRARNDTDSPWTAFRAGSCVGPQSRTGASPLFAFASAGAQVKEVLLHRCCTENASSGVVSFPSIPDGCAGRGQLGFGSLLEACLPLEI